MWNITDYPAWSLGTFNPSFTGSVYGQWSEWLDNHLTNFSRHDSTVRDPDDMWSLQQYAPSLRGWHRDQVYLENFYIVVWSNGLGTEFRTPNGRQIYQAPPNEVVMIDNAAFAHRAPPWKVAKIDVSNRWFARAWVHYDARVKDRPGVYALDL